MNESEIFDVAVKLSAKERAKFLDLACKGDAALRKEIEGLLKAHFDSQTFLADSEEVGARRRGGAEARRGTTNPNSSLAPASGERVG